MERWKNLFGPNVDYNKAIATDKVFCPSDYKNVKGWKQKIESINNKYYLNLKIVKIKVMGHLNVCGLHHGKIIGTHQTDGKLYHDDYYCKVRRGCYLEKKNTEIFALFITENNNENNTEDEIEREIECEIKCKIEPGATWFTFIAS